MSNGSQTTLPVPEQNRPTFLVVDDHLDSAEYLRDALEFYLGLHGGDGFHFEIIVIHTIEEAITMIDSMVELTAVALLTDFHLDPISETLVRTDDQNPQTGIDLIKHFLATRSGSGQISPVTIISSEDKDVLERQEKKLFEQHQVEVITKPVTCDKVEALASRLVEIMTGQSR